MWAMLSLLVPKRCATRARGRGFRLGVEALERRDCLSPGVMEWSDPTGSYASAVALQPDGKVVVVGRIDTNPAAGVSTTWVKRLNPDGSLDTTFNKTGTLTFTVSKSSYATTVALQPDGKILVGGNATAKNGAGEWVVARVNANGSLDNTFGSKGLSLSNNTGADMKKLAVLTDPLHPNTITGIVAAVQGSANGSACFEALKLTPAGVPDKTFGSGGFAVLASVGGGTDEGMAIAPSGEIYLAGAVDVQRADGSLVATGCLAALTPAGKLDSAFGGGAGYVLGDPTGTQGSHYYDVALQTLMVAGQPSTRLVVTGGYWVPGVSGFSSAVTAYTTGGALDTTFGSGGVFTTAGVASGYNPNLNHIALEADGSIVLGGYQSYMAANGTVGSEMLLGHLTAGGAADTSFGPNGTGFVVVQDGTYSEVQGVATDPTDGGIVICGYTFTRPSPRQDFVARFTGPA